MNFSVTTKGMDFERTPRARKRALNLTPMIDIMFILIIFFMLTTTFMRIESLELNLPSVSAKAATEKGEVMHLFIQANGDMLLGSRKVDQDELTESLKRMFEKDANTKVMLLSAEGVTMQQLVGVMDRVYLLGGRSLFVRKWDNAPKQATQSNSGPVQTLPDNAPANADSAKASGNIPETKLAPSAGAPAKTTAPAKPARAPAKPVILH